MGPTRKREELETEELSLSTPFGKLITKGVGVTAMLTFLICGVILAFVWRNNESLAESRVLTVTRYTELNTLMKKQVQAQTLMTCIISVPQERREQEYSQQNSFCRRMAEQ